MSAPEKLPLVLFEDVPVDTSSGCEHTVQVMVERFPDGSWVLAVREHPRDMWSPPVDGKDVRS